MPVTISVLRHLYPSCDLGIPSPGPSGSPASLGPERVQPESLCCMWSPLLTQGHGMKSQILRGPTGKAPWGSGGGSGTRQEHTTDPRQPRETTDAAERGAKGDQTCTKGGGGNRGSSWNPRPSNKGGSLAGVDTWDRQLWASQLLWVQAPARQWQQEDPAPRAGGRAEDSKQSCQGQHPGAVHAVEGSICSCCRSGHPVAPALARATRLADAELGAQPRPRSLPHADCPALPTPAAPPDSPKSALPRTQLPASPSSLCGQRGQLRGLCVVQSSKAALARAVWEELYLL